MTLCGSDESFLGFLAPEAGACSELSERPGRDAAVPHGTSNPWLPGQAVSRGCIRIPTAGALVLKRSAPPGTVVDRIA